MADSKNAEESRPMKPEHVSGQKDSLEAYEPGETYESYQVNQAKKCPPAVDKNIPKWAGR